MDNIKFGKLILKLRKERNMTQKELAEKLNEYNKERQDIEKCNR